MYEHKDNITLRKMQAADLVDLYRLKQESWWGTHKTLFINMDDQRRWFDSLPKDSLYMIAEWPVTEASEDRPIACDAETRSKLVLKAGDKKVWVLRNNVGIAAYTDIDTISRCCKISGSIYKEHRKPEIVKAAFSAGLDFAFEMLNMERVEAEVLEYHLAAQKLEIDHLGFTVEGRRRRAVYKCGRYYDSIILGILRDEWTRQLRVFGYGDTCNLNFSTDWADKMADRAIRESVPA